VDERELDAFLRETHGDAPGCVLVSVFVISALILLGLVLLVLRTSFA
jgi:hypothetical protein